MRVSEWRLVALGDVLEIQHGFAFRGEFYDASGTDVLLTPKNFEPSGGIDVTDRRCKRYSGPTDERFVLGDGDIVVAMTDLKQDAPILGSTGVVPNGGRYLHNQRIGKVLIRDSDRLHRGFVPWLLNSPSVREGVRATATGATVRHTAPARICAIRAPLPSIDVQRRIAAVLSAFDELIEINERRIELLEDLARSLYREWFVHFRFPGHEDVELVDSELGPIPEGWDIRGLFEVADVGFGFPFKSSRFAAAGKGPLIRIRDLPRGRTNTFTDEEPDIRYRVIDGDTLVGMDGEFYVRQWSGGESWLNQRVARLRPLRDLSSRHLMLAVTGPIKAWNDAIVGTTVAHLGKRHLERIRLVIPPPHLLRTAGAVLDSLAELQRSCQHQNHQLAATRDLLLPRLVTGRLDISEIDLGILTPTEVE